MSFSRAKLNDIKYHCERTLDVIDELLNEYYNNETADEFRKRFDDPDEWDIVRDDGLNYAALCIGDDCEYIGKPEGCTIFKMKGTHDFYLCDRCVDNTKNCELRIQMFR
jgi:hypothetical protein